MGIKIRKDCQRNIIPLGELHRGDIGIIINSNIELYEGKLVMRDNRYPHFNFIGDCKYLTITENDSRIEVRILQPGEVLEITE